MKTTVYLCLGTSEYEYDSIGPIFSDESDAEKWVEKCKKLSTKKEKEHENDYEDENIGEIVEKYSKKFKKIEADMYADDYNYITKTMNLIKI